MGIRSQNNPIAAYLDVFSNTGTDAVNAAPPGSSGGHTATGGAISDYSDPGSGNIYRAHVFNASGTFVVTALGSFGNTVQLLVTGGGGGGSKSIQNYWAGNGGGAGGMVEVTGYPVGANTYPITVGSGGNGSSGPSPDSIADRGRTGGDSSFNNPTSTPIHVVAKGGGGGGGSGGSSPGPDLRDGTGGGSGGGVGSAPGSSPRSGPAIVTSPLNPNVNALSGCTLTNYGNVGGDGQQGSAGEGSGGGGAGAVGTSVSSPHSSAHNNPGGAGRANVYAYGPTNPVTYSAGGGAGPTAGAAQNGTFGLGNGGGGGANPTSAEPGGSGGSGTVIVRYQIGSINTPGIKATGGAISFAGSKTVHVFTNSGTFTVTNGPITCDYLVVGGGASGGLGCGGGGGAGGYRTSLPEGPGGPSPSAEPTQAIANGPYAVQVGGGGVIAGNGSRNQTFGGAGTFSNIAFPSAIRAEGGGGGGNIGGSGQPGKPGGSGGGGTYPGGSPAPGNKQSPHSGTPAPNQGYGGGTTNDPANYGAGGGGGAGGAGANGTTTDGGDGGTGKQNTVTGVTLSLAGGGGGNLYYPASTVGDATHGGGQGAPHAGVAPESGPTSIHGHSSTGGGGGGGLRANGPGPATGIPPGLPSSVIAIAGQGGSGIVIIAYPS